MTRFHPLHKPLIPLLAMFCVVMAGCGEKRKANTKVEEIYAEVNREIDKAAEYQEEKEQRILALRRHLAKASDPSHRKELTDMLISEYESYISDSALYYVNLSLLNPDVAPGSRREQELLIRKADIAAHAGLFGESAAILDDLNLEGADSLLLERYYDARCCLYQFQSEYTIDSEFADSAEALRETYIDSVTNYAAPNSMSHVVNRAAAEARNGNIALAEKMLLERLAGFKSGDRNYSILASILADVYKQGGDREKYRQYIALSAISDLRGAVKENMAMRALATLCYEDGDIEYADRFLRQSFADANFFAARMRNAQSSRMLPIIGDAYVAQQKAMNRELKLFVIFISILAAAFVGSTIFAFIQLKRANTANRKTRKMLEEVSSLSQKLSGLNAELSAANSELKKSDTIKEEYVRLFMEYCSLAISNMQQYHQSLRVLAAQGNTKALMRKIESDGIENKTLSEFYAKFDEAILNINPSFIDNFNSLLKPEYRITLRPGETFNTEIRVFALIRMGISDSEKIASFLRCSISTIYTYRSKMKKRALDPDNFESQLGLL